MPLKEDLKSLIIKSGWSMTGVVNELNKRHNSNTTVQNFSSKLIRGTLKYNEVQEVLDVIGFKIKWIKKDEQ